jgi:hypothetical protein
VDASWLPDSRHLAVSGIEAGRGIRTYDLDIATGALSPITPEGTWGHFVSPDGRLIAVSAGGRKGVYDLQSHTMRPLPGEPADFVAGWAADSRALFLYQVGETTAHVVRFDIESGVRTDLATIQISDPAGVVSVSNLLVAPDGDHYVYRYARQISQLYQIKF